MPQATGVAGAQDPAQRDAGLCGRGDGRAGREAAARRPSTRLFHHRQTHRLGGALRHAGPERDRGAAAERGRGGAGRSSGASSASCARRCWPRPARWRGVAAALAEVDVAAALADLALQEGWTRPVLDESRDFEVRGGRHPVVEAALRRQGKAFVANDCDLSERAGAAADRAQHGRQEHLPAAGGAARRAGAGGELRAGASRCGWGW